MLVAGVVLVLLFRLDEFQDLKQLSTNCKFKVSDSMKWWTAAGRAFNSQIPHQWKMRLKTELSNKAYSYSQGETSWAFHDQEYLGQVTTHSFFSVYNLFCCHCSYIFMFKIKQSINQKTMRWRSDISFGAVSKFKNLNLKMKKKNAKTICQTYSGCLSK